MIRRFGDLIEGALRQAGLEATTLIWQIAERWPEVVGDRVAAKATPTRLEKGELVLSAPEAVWRQELILLGPEIADRVNRNLGKKVVDRVRLVAGPTTSPDRKRLIARKREGPPPASATTAAPSLEAAIEALARARPRKPAPSESSSPRDTRRVRLGREEGGRSPRRRNE